MESHHLFGISAVKQEAEDTNGDKDISENSHPVLLMEDEANFSAIPCGISAECQLINDPLKLESNFDEDEALHDNAINSQEGYGLEMNSNCQREMAIHISVFGGNDVTKQVVSSIGEKPFNCDICKKCFNSSTKLSRHQKTHAKEKIFKCDLCRKHFVISSDLHHHQRSHAGEKHFECNVCNKLFASNTNLSEHKRIHTGEKPFECDICERTFRQRSTLSNHQRTHTGEKRFVCNICNKRFASSTCLSDHQNTHNGEKPFVCDICKKCFTSS
ncbi:hypothetical protein QYM36_009693, partial [Artemia franciscana]